MREQSVEGLMGLGFTELEAQIYVFLMREAPVTGYRVAQGLGKAVANTYKAIESLRNKGAVLVDDGENRLCRPVPASELLGRLERAYRDETEKTLRALSEINVPAGDDRVYHLSTAEQVFERCRRMLEQCRTIALLDVFPLPLEVLRADLEAAAARGLVVGAKVYAPASLKGVRVISHARGGEIQKRWPGQWLNILIDGTEHLMAFLTRDGKGVHQAVWSGSPYLSFVYHSAFSSELLFTLLRPMVEKGVPVAEIRRVLRDNQALLGADAPGYQTLLRRFKTARRQK